MQDDTSTTTTSVDTCTTTSTTPVVSTNGADTQSTQQLELKKTEQENMNTTTSKPAATITPAAAVTTKRVRRRRWRPPTMMAAVTTMEKSESVDGHAFRNNLRINNNNILSATIDNAIDVVTGAMGILETKMCGAQNKKHKIPSSDDNDLAKKKPRLSTHVTSLVESNDVKNAIKKLRTVKRKFGMLQEHIKLFNIHYRTNLNNADYSMDHIASETFTSIIRSMISTSDNE